LWLAGIALVGGALLLIDALLWQPGLTEENARRIRQVLTLAEVEALLGGPAADTRSRCPPTTRPFGGNRSGGRAARPSWCSSPRWCGGQFHKDLEPMSAQRGSSLIERHQGAQRPQTGLGAVE
jgi:hypothetical protein